MDNASWNRQGVPTFVPAARTEARGAGREKARLCSLRAQKPGVLLTRQRFREPQAARTPIAPADKAAGGAPPRAPAGFEHRRRAAPLGMAQAGRPCRATAHRAVRPCSCGSPRRRGHAHPRICDAGVPPQAAAGAGKGGIKPAVPPPAAGPQSPYLAESDSVRTSPSKKSA